MKLSISNIGWDISLDETVYKKLHDLGCSGLEIAPSRIVEHYPYDNQDGFKNWYEHIKKYFEISSMQSILYGKNENIFGTESERKVLLECIKKAIDLAEILECKNLVFGCPKNRNNINNLPIIEIVPFFKEIGDYAFKHRTIVAIEANPKIYGTNFINTTKEAIDFVKNVSSDGIRVNLDIGAMINNKEKLDDVLDNIELINHVHISEPMLEIISNYSFHEFVIKNLIAAGYKKYFSIEMLKQEINSVYYVVNKTVEIVEKYELGE